MCYKVPLRDVGDLNFPDLFLFVFDFDFDFVCSPLLSHGRFFLDCIYVHRKPSEEGVVCQEAFDLIAGMETFGGGSVSFQVFFLFSLQAKPY